MGNSASLSSLSPHLSFSVDKFRFFFSQQFLDAAALGLIGRPLKQSFQVLDVFPVNKASHWPSPCGRPLTFIKHGPS
jgi:hypothetical protein